MVGPMVLSRQIVTNSLRVFPMVLGGTNRNEGDRKSRIGRRRVLGATGLLIAGGMAGCIGGPMPYTELSVSVRKSFETKQPLSVPLSIEVYGQNVDDTHVALRGVELLLLDDSLNVVAGRELGDFSRQTAPPANRGREKDDSFLVSSTTYSASWELERDIEMVSIPTWVTFRVGAVEFGDSEDREASSLLIGRARALSPPPDLSVTALRLESDPDGAPSLDPTDYRPERFDAFKPVDREGIFVRREEETTTEPASSTTPK